MRVRGQERRTTTEHSFFVPGHGWVEKKDLAPGELLRGHDGQLWPVDAVTASTELATVYNCRIADYHTYFVQAPGGPAWVRLFTGPRLLGAFADLDQQPSVEHMVRRPPVTLEWIGPAATGQLRLLDQTLLPGVVAYRVCESVQDVWQAIRRLQVRGAPAIGVAAAYGVVIGVREPAYRGAGIRGAVEGVADYLATSRPTAVNLFHALDRMRSVARELPAETELTAGQAALLQAARRWHQDDIDLCDAIAEHGAPLVPEGGGVLTHCNTGALATAGIGTALGCIIRAAEQGRRFTVYVDETRPLLQGARLTAWELQQAGLQPILVCDNMAGHLMRLGRVHLVIVGADRIAANGDTANKIGTYSLAVLARHHGIPFYVAAPRTTFDLGLPNGAAIPVEERAADEVTTCGGQRVAPDGVQVFNAAFDVTPGELITGIITEAGVVAPGKMSARG